MIGSLTATHCVQDKDGAELNEAVQRHVPEETEGGDQRTPALSTQTQTEKKVLFFLSSSADDLLQTLQVWLIFKDVLT